MSEHYLNDVIEAYRKALPAFLHGDPEPVLALFSARRCNPRQPAWTASPRASGR